MSQIKTNQRRQVNTSIKKKSVSTHEAELQAERGTRVRYRGFCVGTRFNSEVNIRAALNGSNFFVS